MHYLWNASAHQQKKVVHTCTRFFVDALVHYIKTYIICGMRQRIYKKLVHTQAFRMHFRLTWSLKPATGTRNQNHSKCAPPPKPLDHKTKNIRLCKNYTKVTRGDAVGYTVGMQYAVGVKKVKPTQWGTQ